MFLCVKGGLSIGKTWLVRDCYRSQVLCWLYFQGRFNLSRMHSVWDVICGAFFVSWVFSADKPKKPLYIVLLC